VSEFDDALKVVSELINNSENPKNVLISTYTEKYTTVSMEKSIAVKLLLKIEGKEFDLKSVVEKLEKVKSKLRGFWVDFDDGYIEIVFDLNYYST